MKRSTLVTSLCLVLATAGVAGAIGIEDVGAEIKRFFRKAFVVPVQVTDTPTDGDALVYDSTTGTWRAESVSTPSASALLDTIGSTRGSLLYRGAAAWSARTPGTSGLPLLSAGAGADPDYGALGAGSGGTGLTSYTAGDVPYATGATTIAKLAIGAADTVAYSTGTAPAWGTLSSRIDTISSTRGVLLYRGAAGWAARSPGTSGLALLSAGAGADPDYGALGAGAGGTGLTSYTAGDVPYATGATTIAKLAIGAGDTVAYSTGTAPAWGTLSSRIDTIGSTRGQILYRNATVWTVLSPGTSGLPLLSAGAGADPAYGALGAGAGGTGITSYTAGDTIYASAATTFTKVAIGAANTVGYSTGSAPAWRTLTAQIDAAIGSTQGSILYRDGSAWVALTPGTNGQVLTTNGAAANPAWAAPTTNVTVLNKTADESVTSSTTVQADNHLTTTLSASSTYTFHFLICVTGTQPGGWRVTVNGTVGVTSIKWAYRRTASVGTSPHLNTALGTEEADPGLGEAGIIEILGSIETSTSGTFELRWAQDTSNGTATTFARNSYLVLTKK